VTGLAGGVALFPSVIAMVDNTGINAPEVAHAPGPRRVLRRHHHRHPRRARPAGLDRLAGQRPAQDSRDVYGRLLRYVEHNHHDLSRQLLRAGAARLYDSRPAITRAREYAETTETTRTDQHGLWGAC